MSRAKLYEILSNPTLAARAMRALFAIAVLTELLWESVAEARVGGGHSWSSGRRSGSSFSGGSSRSSYSGGSSGGDSDVLFLLLHLVIRYPKIGIPLILVVGAFLAIKALSKPQPRWSPGSSAPPPLRVATDLSEIAKVDPGFSEPVFLDFVQLVHRRATEATVNARERAALAPFVDEAVWPNLAEQARGATAVSEVILGGVEVIDITVGHAETRIGVLLKSNRLEERDGQTRRVYMQERWTFRRKTGAVSLPPEETLRLGCPSCGVAVETDRMGACTHCGTPITKGQLQWQVASAVPATVVRPVSPPEIGASDGGDEPSVHDYTLKDPNLGAQLRGLVGRHPDFVPKDFQQHVRDVYFALQTAWSEDRWSAARPHVTDSLYQSLRFWTDGYQVGGLRNHLDDIQLEKMEIVKVGVDAWYESITLRIWGSMRDYTVNERGQLVGGNREVPRRFSEYWTFLRAAGTGAGSRDAQHCPSCGAPLDNVSHTGVCGYCDTRIASGTFDWVLSRIDQTDVYRG